MDNYANILIANDTKLVMANMAKILIYYFINITNIVAMVLHSIIFMLAFESYSISNLYLGEFKFTMEHFIVIRK
jgi:hypothetical protein